MDQIKQLRIYPPEKGSCIIIVVFEVPDQEELPQNGLLPIPLGLHPCNLFMEISFQFKVLPAQDKRLPIFRIITRQEVI